MAITGAVPVLVSLVGSDRSSTQKQDRMEGRIAKLEERRPGNGAAERPRPAASYSTAAAKAVAGQAAEKSEKKSGQQDVQGLKKKGQDGDEGKDEVKKKTGTSRGKTGASSYSSRRQSAVSFSDDHQVFSRK